MAALITLSLAALSSASIIGDLLSLPSTTPDISACVKTPSFYSCENTTAITNTCCSPTPGGLVLQTQFWYVHHGFKFLRP
jgi:ribonuclease T2